MQATVNLLPKQTEAWEAFESTNITELGYGGAAGGGKTRLGCYLAITIAELYPGSRGCIGRKELKTLRLTTLATLWEIMAEMGYKKDDDYRYNAQDGIIKFSNGSEIFILDTAESPQDPEYTRFGSLELTWGWIDESNETPEKGRNILKTRVGRKNVIQGKQVKPFWLETFNPNKGHIFRNYYKPWKDKTLPEYRMFIRALPGDNPHLPESYIEELKRSPDKTIRERLLKGNFDYDNDPLKLMVYDAIVDLTTNTIDQQSEKFLINDVARFGGDKIVLGAFKGLELFALGVYTYQGTDETVKQIKEWSVDLQIAFSRILTDEDGVGGGVVDNMKGTKGFIGNATPVGLYEESTLDKKPTVANFQNLRAQCYFKLSDIVNTRKMAVKVTVFKTNIEGYSLNKALEDIQEELDAIKQKETEGKLAIIPKSELKEALGRSPDFADMLMMRMYYELREPEAILSSEQRARQYMEAKRNLTRTTR